MRISPLHWLLLHLRIDTGTLTGGPVRVDLLLVEQFHLLVALSPDLIDGGTSAGKVLVVVGVLVPVLVLAASLLVFSGSHGDLWQVTMCLVARLQSSISH